MSQKTKAEELEALAAARWRVAAVLTAAMLISYFGFILLVAFNKPLMGKQIAPGLSPRHPAGRAGHRLGVGVHRHLRAVGQPPLRQGPPPVPPLNQEPRE